jgi:hypothetical protein
MCRSPHPCGGTNVDRLIQQIIIHAIPRTFNDVHNGHTRGNHATWRLGVTVGIAPTFWRIKGHGAGRQYTCPAPASRSESSCPIIAMRGDLESHIALAPCTPSAPPTRPASPRANADHQGGTISTNLILSNVLNPAAGPPGQSAAPRPPSVRELREELAPPVRAGTGRSHTGRSPAFSPLRIQPKAWSRASAKSPGQAPRPTNSSARRASTSLCE